MTAMCDVAFLLLSFFILAAKQKPPSAITVNTPSSVAHVIAKEDAILVTLNKDGKVFLSVADKLHREAIFNDINTSRQLGLSALEMEKLKNLDFIGLPLNMIKGSLDLKVPVPANQLPGIPCGDSANNELTDWLRSVMNAYKGEDIKKLNLLVKGDNVAKYPFFKNIESAFKKNEIFRFKIVTNPQSPPAGSELYLHPPTEN